MAQTRPLAPYKSNGSELPNADALSLFRQTTCSIKRDVGRGYACYFCCMPSFPVLLHIYCPHPLSCCIYTALIPCVAAYILHLFLYFLHRHPYIFQHFVFTLVSLVFPCILACKYNALCMCLTPTHFSARSHAKCP